MTMNAIMLIYTVSLKLQSPVDMTINNQHTNIKLASPIYFTKDTTCHIQFPQQVDSNSMVKVKFRTDMDQDTFGGVLLYHLQRKENINAQLFVVWGHKYNKIYSYAWLIEHESALAWNEDRLKRLYDVYDDQLNREIFIMKEWLLDDNTKLKTKCELSSIGLEIIISEEKNLLSPTKPLWIDPNR
jgi:hypothetical protein